MNANLHLDDDLATYLNERSTRELTWFEELLKSLQLRLVHWHQTLTHPQPYVRIERRMWPS